MRTVARFGALTCSIAVVIGWWLESVGAGDVYAVGPRVEVVAASKMQLDLVDWAVDRFDDAGLEAPAVEIEFHDDPDGCSGHLGFAMGDHVDVCTTLVNAMTRRALLHEMSHVWLDQNVTAATRARFLALRGLRSWNSSGDPWRLRGFEQAAEIMAWMLGERILTAQVPGNRPSELEAAFELITEG